MYVQQNYDKKVDGDIHDGDDERPHRRLLRCRRHCHRLQLQSALRDIITCALPQF